MKLVYRNVIKLATSMPENLPYLCSTVVLLTDGESLSHHKDVQNHRLSRNATTSFGHWTGGVLQIQDKETWVDMDSRDSWVVLDARITRHRATEVTGTRLSITYHTPQHLHRLQREDWDQLQTSGFPVDRVWEQGLSSADYMMDHDAEIFSQTMMSVRQLSQAWDVETQTCLVEDINVDHNAFLKPILQAVCWLTDMILSTD